MNRANYFITSLPILLTTMMVGIAWLLAWQASLSGSCIPSIRVLLLRLKMALALLKLKEHHLREDIVLRQAGFRDGIWIWETTLGLARKTAAYLLVRLLNDLLQ